MKSTRRFLSAALLTFVFAAAAFADDGIIHGDSPTPSDGIIHGDSPTPIDGIIHGDSPASSDNGADTTSCIVEAALSVIGNIIAI